MRARLGKAQVVVVRPLVAQDGKATSNAFGDSTVLVSKTRAAGFRVKMQMTWTRGMVGGQGVPGRDLSLEQLALVLKRDILGSQNPTWTPQAGDLIETNGASLFIEDVQPGFPRNAMGIGADGDGGWDGWRLTVRSRDPGQSAAGTYE